MHDRIKLLPILMLSFASVAATACVITPEPEVAEEPQAVDIEEYEGYRPLRYDGYVVYYADDGRPYYYVGGAAYWVPRTYARYHVLTRHYVVHRHVYARWYVRHGVRYRTYRYHR
jgi:hypothetical protein